MNPNPLAGNAGSGDVKDGGDATAAASARAVPLLAAGLFRAGLIEAVASSNLHLVFAHRERRAGVPEFNAREREVISELQDRCGA